MLNSLLLKVYSGLWAAASPLLKRNRRLADGFDQRLVPNGWPGFAADDKNGPRIWLQAASGGEARLAHSLLPAFIAALAQSHGPDKTVTCPKILCTSCTRQGLDVLQALPPEIGAATGFFPLDAPALMDRALDAVRPHLLVLLETELWPGLLNAAKRRGIPVIIVNGRMTDKSRKAYSLLPFFWRAVAPARVLAISPDDSGRFAGLFNCPVETMPNIKFDGLAQAAAAQPPPSIRAGVGISEQTPLAVFASVREEEEDLLIPVIKNIVKLEANGLSAAAAVAPRHMHRVDAWRKKLAKAGISFAPRSQSASFENSNIQVCLWDSFGELQALYASADAAFVGGSLAPLGGQNFLEAPALGVPALVGPHTGNFNWAGEDIFASGLVRRVSNADELDAALRGQLAGLFGPFSCPAKAAGARAAAADSVRQRFMDWLTPKTGGSAQAAEVMVDMTLALNSAAC